MAALNCLTGHFPEAPRRCPMGVRPGARGRRRIVEGPCRRALGSQRPQRSPLLAYDRWRSGLCHRHPRRSGLSGSGRRPRSSAKNLPRDFQGKVHSVWGFSESPLVDGDKLLCTPGGPEAGIVALDKKPAPKSRAWPFRPSATAAATEPLIPRSSSVTEPA